MKEHAGSYVLVLTVGTGNRDDLEGSLYSPLIKSISTGHWDHVVLLPSQSTVEQAVELKKRIHTSPVKIRPIPDHGDENDADACFTHFDSVLGGTIADGFSPAQITLDFTRGTKAMSAALVLAGVGREIPVLRYIQGMRGRTGSVQPGTEKIREVRTEAASARQQLDQAERLMKRGAFEAVCALHNDRHPLPDTVPRELRNKFESFGAVADIYAAWDRFDFSGAAAKLEKYLQRAGAFTPTPDMEDWIATLSREVVPAKYAETALHLRHLVCDILASAERRLRDGHYEDAGIRCYRVLELVGQVRLFDRGYDSSCLPGDDPKVEGFQKKQRKKKRNPLSENTSKELQGTFKAARNQVAFFLSFLGDPLAKKLIMFGESEEHVKARNVGILIHGFEAKAARLGTQRLEEHICKLEALLLEDDPGAAKRLAVARSLDFSGT